MKISDNIYLLDSTRGSYVYLVTGKENTLIDTGLPWMGKGILKDLASLGIKYGEIKHIMLTHHDVDHVSNAAMLQQLTGAQVWASKEDMPYITGETDRYGFKKYLKYIFRAKKPHGITSYSSGQKVNGIEVVPTAGHTPGHVCLLHEDVIFAGDLVENKKGTLIPYPAPWNWNDELLMESIRSISRIPFNTICPAHGKPIRREGNWKW